MLKVIYIFHQAKKKSNDSSIDKSIGMLLYSFATGNVKTSERLNMMVDYICCGKIASQAQLTGNMHGVILSYRTPV
jgi:hypothetical protein